MSRPPSREALSRRISADVAAYEAAGNRVEVVPAGVSGVPRVELSPAERRQWLKMRTDAAFKARPAGNVTRSVRREPIPQRLAIAAVAAVDGADVPTPTNTRLDGAAARALARNRVAALVLRDLGAPRRQICAVLGGLPASHLDSYFSRALPAERRLAGRIAAAVRREAS